MHIQLDPISIELEVQDLLKLGWRIVPASCPCGHNKAWAVPLSKDGPEMTYGCITCTKIFLLQKRVDLSEYEAFMTEEGRIAENERVVSLGLGPEDMEAFRRENDFDRD